MQRPALVFDGDCAFCSRCAGLARRILPAGCAVVPWQEVDLATAGFTADRARTEVIWVDRDGAVSGGAPAVARALRAAGGFWAVLGLLLSLPPIRWVAPPVYRLVAANRYRLPGGTAACRVPGPAAPREAAGSGGHGVQVTCSAMASTSSRVSESSACMRRSGQERNPLG